jgi:hypothetical protein
LTPDPDQPLGAARALGVAALAVLAALGIVRAIGERRLGGVNAAKSEARLAELERALAPPAELLPPSEPLRYAWPLDARGRPHNPQDFAFVQAVLAPRRIGHHLEVRYVLAHHRTPEAFALVPGLGGARRVAELGPGFTLLERADR